MLSQQEMKRAVGEKAAELVQSGMRIGVGTGTTAYWLILALGKRVLDGLDIAAVATSRQTFELASEHGIPMLELDQVERLDLTIDGADEVNPQLDLIKGGGGALLQEKMVAAASNRMVVIADESKLVRRLGAFPLPVEVIPVGWKQVLRRIRELGCDDASIRQAGEKPLVTDHGHHILDCRFGAIADPRELNAALHDIPGVVETGLFCGMASEVIVCSPGGVVRSVAATE